MFKRRLAPLIIFGASAAATAGSLSIVGTARAACTTGAVLCMPTYNLRTISRTAFQYINSFENGSVYEASIPQDTLYTFQQSTATSAFFDYLPYATNVTTHIAACHQSYASSTSTCSSATNTPTTLAPQDVSVTLTGIHSILNSVWDYYTIRVWGNLDNGSVHTPYNIIGSGFDIPTILPSN